jgi:hypothetical protein
MKKAGWTANLALVNCILAVAAGALAVDSPNELIPETIESVDISLNSWGANLGYLATFDGDDPRIREFVELVRGSSEPARGHKCANVGAVRFHLDDGSVVALGLLPGHTEGSYGVRLYSNERYIAHFVLDRDSLLAALGELGVPIDDPAFKE